ncbi:T-cell surface glycoprotein CD3 epsilon chain isoform X2 [Trichechus manatus latirostris]|uniref:T-cell surface glycoprotein CD3 epsilon chain n=1 Tax=Trichechus manatus latirostris TaxID=127582 RepID=A0A2Y9RMM8_TRIMA|nr:T-cell surface glycoprotein CD3 epsilon chain isoform X2 [Trichechus manatus latirostris]
MPPGVLWVYLGLCLLSGGSWEQPDNEEKDDAPRKSYKVSISGTKVVLTCPEESDSPVWKHNDKDVGEPANLLVLDDFSEVENSGYYDCSNGNGNKGLRLYLKARVCESCMEVNLLAVVAIVIGDICITLGLLLVVYYWSKNRKAKAKPVKRGTGAGGRPRGKNKEKPPPVPNPDYEPIRKGQQDLYAGLNQRNI